MKGAAVMEEFGPDWIVAIGGGSPIDATKGYVDQVRISRYRHSKTCVKYSVLPEIA